ncbi:MAG: hypothetical protein GXO24_01050 [Chlorobi bacterium]|nr:hypothetical protein [Chlorobiota bacterium]
MIRILLYIIIIYLVFRLIGRILAPIWIHSMMKKAQKRFEEQFNNPYYGQKEKTEPGKTYITRKKPPHDNIEDADFEEIDD